MSLLTLALISEGEGDKLEAVWRRVWTDLSPMGTGQ